MKAYILQCVVLVACASQSCGKELTLESLAAELAAQRTVMADQEAAINYLRAELAESKERTAVLEASRDPVLHARQAGLASKVAFQAFLAQPITSLTLHQTIPFNRVTVNVGGAFNPSTSTFTCPVNGVYVFQSSLMAQNGKMVQTQIMQEGVEGGTVYAAGAASGHGFDQGFNSFVTACRAGQRVYVRNYHGQGQEIFALTYTSFSGFLLYPVDIV